MLQLDGEPGVPKVPHLLHALTRRSGYRDASEFGSGRLLGSVG